jgi:hypothetical protein
MHSKHPVTTFHDLVSKPFRGAMNAICWSRPLLGDFSEIVQQAEPESNMAELSPEQLLALSLSEAGQLARHMLLSDLSLLTAHGASPTLNLIRWYERDDACLFFPTDVYSFHVDRAPVPCETFLCTYHGACSEILPNAQAERKVLVPEIREALRERYAGAEQGFEAYLSNHCYDLHYQTMPAARPIRLGLGHLWRLAVDHPGSNVLPCIHRAPEERKGETRLLLIC